MSLSKTKIGILCPNKRFFGAQLCSTAFYYNLKQLFPNAEIIAFSPTPKIDIIKSLGFIDKVHVHDIKAGIKDLLGTAKLLRSYKFDLLFTLRRKSERDWFLNLISGAKLKIGFKRKYSHLIYDRYTKYDKQIYRGTNFLNLISLITEKPLNYKLMFQDYKPNSPKSIWLIPGSQETERQWPIDNYIELAHKIIVELDINVSFVLGASEESYLEYIKNSLSEHSDQLFVIDKSYGALELLGEVNNCIMSISNNCGPAHAVQVSGVQSLVMFNKGTNVYEWINREGNAEELISPEPNIDSLSVDFVVKTVIKKMAKNG